MYYDIQYLRESSFALRRHRIIVAKRQKRIFVETVLLQSFI